MGERQSTEMSLKEIKSGATLFLILLVSTSQMYANINIFITQTSCKNYSLLLTMLTGKIDNFNGF